MAGLVVMAVCNALALAAPEPWLLFLARTLIGVGTALSFIGGSDFVRASRGTPFAQGLYGGLATAGGGVALAVVPALEGWIGWRAPFVSAIAVAGVAGALLALAPHPARPGARVGSAVPLTALVRDRSLLRLAVVFAGSFGLSVVIANWVVTLLEGNADLRPETAGAIGALTLVLGVVSRPLGGWLHHRGADRVRAGVVIAALVGAIGTLALTSGSPSVALVGASPRGSGGRDPVRDVLHGSSGVAPGGACNCDRARQRDGCAHGPRRCPARRRRVRPRPRELGIRSDGRALGREHMGVAVSIGQSSLSSQRSGLALSRPRARLSRRR